MEKIKQKWMSLCDSEKSLYMPQTPMPSKPLLHAKNSSNSADHFQQIPEISGIKNIPSEDEVLGEVKFGEKECSDVQTTKDEGMSPLKQGINHFYSMILE